jgi:hypothetical protein
MAGIHLRRVAAFVATLALALAIGTGSARAWCKGAVSASAARHMTGRLVRVKARVVRSYYASSSNGSPTFIDFVAAYPSPARLTLVIWGENRTNFPSAPERMFRRGVLVCAQGVVTLYQGVAEIEVGSWDAVGRTAGA